MKSIVVAVIIAGLAVPACAQGMSSGMPGAKGRHGQQQKEEQPKRKVDEKDYKSALDKLPDKKFDPWQGVREQPQPK